MIKRILVILIVGLLASQWANAGGPAGSRILFFIEPDREKETLEADADLIWQSVQAGEPGDAIEVMELSGKRVMSLNVRKMNPLHAKREKSFAANALR